MQNYSIIKNTLALFAVMIIAATNVQADDKTSKEPAVHTEHETASPVMDHKEVKGEKGIYDAAELTKDESLGSYQCPPFSDKKSCLAEVQKKQSACLEGVKSMGIHTGTVDECLKRADARKVSCAKHCSK